MQLNLKKNQYPMAKTLRFELRPMGMSEENVEAFKKQVEEILQADYQRADAYPRVKEIMDDYYRYYFSKVLPEIVISEKKLQEAYKLYKKFLVRSNGKEEKAAYEKVEAELRETISEFLNGQKERYGLNKYSRLFNKKDGFLFAWIHEGFEAGLYSEAEGRNMISDLAVFDEFVTYFRNFQINRDNLFKSQGASSISHRMINDNMRLYFNNCIKFERIQENYPDLFQLLVSEADLYKPERYQQFLSQSAINQYNQQIGRASDPASAAGINQKINAYRQTHEIRPKALPVMERLKKQLLSKKDGFETERIETDHQLFALIKRSVDEAINLIKALKVISAELITADNADMIFINPKFMEDLSLKVYGGWALLRDATLKDKRAKKDRLFTIGELQIAADQWIDAMDESIRPEKKTFVQYFNQFDVRVLEESIKGIGDILSQPELDPDRTLPSDENSEGGKGFQQIAKIKSVLDGIKSAYHFYKPLSMIIDSGKKEKESYSDERMNLEFYARFNEIFEELEGFNKPYEDIRNYLTKKPYSQEKIKLNFECGTLLSGWDENKIEANQNVLLMKDDQYYLGILNKKTKKLFSDPGKYGCTDDVPHYKKMVYKQVSNSAKMFSKVFFSEKQKEVFNPSEEIAAIRKMDSIKRNEDKTIKRKWIGFLIECVQKHPEWNDHFEFQFKEPDSYPSVNDFYADMDAQLYKMSFENVSESFIHNAVKSGELFLFRLHNKDFSPHSKGTPNLHTLYWRALFSETNLSNIGKPELPIIKLNGEAELFLREKSIQAERPTHPANQPIRRKQIDVSNGKSCFPYDIVKDRRYTEDKMFLHVPITLNFRAGKVSQYDFNINVNQAVREDASLHLIGLDRGERNLLSFVVINRKGEIVDQGSFNMVGKPETVDYWEKLHVRENERDRARKSWGAIGNIKDLKSGYLSIVVHELCKLIEKYNAIIVLEDLNMAFKRSRQKIEKQVYQKFEKAMIEKLNYLVFKDRQPDEPGGALNGFQLTAPFTSYESVKGQTGIIYYVTAAYTSKICPRTGYIPQGFYRYKNADEFQKYLNAFDFFRYNLKEDHFEFLVDFNRIPMNNSTRKCYGKTNWLLSTAGTPRIARCPNNYYVKVDVTHELKKMLKNAAIEFCSGRNIIADLQKLPSKADMQKIISLTQLTMQVRHTAGKQPEEDYILSPVRDADGKFFDSRSPRLAENGRPIEPVDADTNGAYHIALKGLQIVQNIDDNGRINKKNCNLNAFLEGVQMIKS